MFRYQLSENWSTMFGYAKLEAELDRGTNRLEVDVRLDGLALALESRF